MPEIQKWEYQIFFVGMDHTLSTLNDLGEEGWEYCAPAHTPFKAIFKRPKVVKVIPKSEIVYPNGMDA